MSFLTNSREKPNDNEKHTRAPVHFIAGKL